MPKITIYTDGSGVNQKTSPMHGYGGIGIVFLIDGVVKKKFKKGYKNTTNNRMELKALITALRMLDKSEKATIYSDSKYSIDPINKRWIYNWELQGWTCKNPDLMKELLEVYKKFKRGAIKLVHVKGHAGHEFNEMADELADYKTHKDYEVDVPEETSTGNEILASEVLTDEVLKKLIPKEFHDK